MSPLGPVVVSVRDQLEVRFPAPLLAAAGTALYVVGGALWMAYSRPLAAAILRSAPNSAAFELGRDYLFLGGTSVVLFLGLMAFGRRIRAQQAQIVNQAEALARSEQAVAAGTFAAATAHDINNSLMVAMAATESVSGEGQRDLVAAHKSIHEMTRRMADLGSRVSAVDEAFDVGRLLSALVRSVSRQPIVQGCRVQLQPSGPLWFIGSQTLLRRAVLNMIMNAAEATGGKGKIEIAALREGDQLVVRVDDDGPGISALHREEMFRSFFTTKPDGHGLGLMSMVACAQRHGGQVAASESPLGGARVWLGLPHRDPTDIAGMVK